MSKLTYRKEIDGLRAIAILSVVFFHAGIQGFSGGYVGVDIFYVISGYLITSIIYREILNGDFRFRGFWLRRARRILPASMFMVMICVIAFAFIYPTNFYQEFLGTVLANQFFVSNILFWKQGGYFATAQEIKPLLHTWSLSIEEQFYLLFPVFLLFLYRFFRPYLFLIVAGSLLISLLLSVYASKYHSYAAFYLIPTRAWELGAGGLIAIMNEKHLPLIRSSRMSQWIGMILILIPVFLYDDKTPFPSFFALMPVLGATLLILTKQPDSIVSRVLCSRLFVFIGMISYSVYLWHWPVMVIKHWLFNHSETISITIAAVALSFVLGGLSYRFIETPTRDRKRVSDRKLVKGVLISSGATLIFTFGLMITGNNVLVDQDGTKLARYNKAIEPEQSRGECTDRLRQGKKEILCGEKPSPDQGVDVFVWGDSHAGAMIPAFYKISAEHSVNFEYAITSGCQPILGMHRVDQFQSCQEANQRVIQTISDNRYPLVLLIGSFVNNVTTGRLRDIRGEPNADLVTRMSEFRNRFAETVDAIKKTGSKVYVFTEPPRFQINPPFEELRASTLGVKNEVPTLTRSEHKDRIYAVYQLIDQSAIDARLDYTEFFCPYDICRHQHEGLSMYKDKSHISNFASELLSDYFISDLHL